jgi:hypothetical protein
MVFSIRRSLALAHTYLIGRCLLLSVSRSSFLRFFVHCSSLSIRRSSLFVLALLPYRVDARLIFHYNHVYEYNKMEFVQSTAASSRLRLDNHANVNTSNFSLIAGVKNLLRQRNDDHLILFILARDGSRGTTMEERAARGAKGRGG